MLLGTGTNHPYLLSAQDLLAFRDCPHKAALNRRALTDDDLRAWLRQQKADAHQQAEDSGLPADDPSIARGTAHELEHLANLEAQGLTIVRIECEQQTSAEHRAAAHRATLQAMRDGVEVIYQAVLLDDPWFGFADFLMKVDGAPSALGDHAYAVHDTKLARSLRAKDLLQLAFYGLILETMQGAPPPHLAVVLGTGETAEWPYRDAAPYTEQLRQAMRAFHAEQPPTEPSPVPACGMCRWHARCGDEWGEQDLLHVHRLGTRQRTLLRDAGITTIHALADASDEQRPQRIARDTFDRLRAQAAVQVGDAPYELIRPQARGTGLLGVPEPHPLDVFFDLEGDPFAADLTAGRPTLDYLWAFVDADGDYHHRFAHTHAEEDAAFAWFLEELRDRERQGGEWHVYHYAAYELAALRRLASTWPDEAERDGVVDEVERFIATRFVDLYRHVEHGLRTRDGSTSLKIVEVLAGYDRHAQEAGVARGDDSIKAYELAIAASTAPEDRARILDGIRAYNEHDVRATRAVRDWVLDRADDLAVDDVVDEEPQPYERSAQLQERLDRIAAAAAELSTAIAAADAAGTALPSGLSTHGARLLVGMLWWHRKEEAVAWGDHYRLQTWALDGGSIRPDGDGSGPTSTADELLATSPDAQETGIRPGTEHESVLQEVQVVAVEPPAPGKRAHTYRLTCLPGAWKVRAGDRVVVVQPEEARTEDGSDRHGAGLELVEFDAADGTAAIRAMKPLPERMHALVLQPFSGGHAPWESVMRVAGEATSTTPEPWARAAFALLDRIPPAGLAALPATSGDDAAAQRALAACSSLQVGETLPVQGPPGTGKTWLAAQAIVRTIAERATPGGTVRIGVTANSHKVIDNLLAEVVRRAAADGRAVRVVHAGNKDPDNAGGGVEQCDGSEEAEAIVREPDASAVVMGATKYVWSRPDLRGALDLLVVDEAGQVPLTDAVAVAPAAQRILAVGDPQQLAAPIQAAHEEDVRASLLEHLIRGAETIAPEHGVFLDRSHRMHHALCQVVGHLAYAGTLRATKVANARSIAGGPLHVAGLTVDTGPGVRHLPVPGGEDAEIEATVELVQALLAGDVRVSEPAVSPDAARLGTDDVLVVAPHNATVNRLAALMTGIAVGTVDRFQGRQAHVVVYAMGRTAERAGDVPFLYELNRINVALSRARLTAFVVSSPEALLPPVSEPEHLMLASRFAAAIGA